MKNGKKKKTIQNDTELIQNDDASVANNDVPVPSDAELSQKVDDFLHDDAAADSVPDAPIIDKKQKWIKMGKDHKVLRIIVLLLILLVLFRIGSAVYDKISPEVEKEEQTAVQTAVAGMADISSTAPITGRILPSDEVAIVPLVSGKVTAVHAKVGEYVNAGTVLFEIDRTQATATYNQAKAAYDLANTSYNNAVTLYNAGAVSKTSLDQAYVSYVSSKESFNAAAEMYGYYSVTSPISGYVTSLSVDVGSIAGQTMAASVANTDSLSIDTTVSEYLATKLQQGQEVEIHVSSLKDKTYKGIITELSPAPAYGTLTYPISIALKDTSGDIKAGMFAEVIVKDSESTNVLCVPSDAVFAKAGENIVVVLDDKNVASYAKVTTGIDNGELVEIISGLKAGDVIVVSGQQYVDEGETVKIIKGDTKASNPDSAASKSKAKSKDK